jgi:hypothetical protein
MNPKTKEAIAEVLEDLDLRLKFNRDEALAKICAIVEKEREEPTPAYLNAHKKLWEEAVKEQQKLYRENQRLQCEIDRLLKPDQEGK